jgi:hypothetical protein
LNQEYELKIASPPVKFVGKDCFNLNLFIHFISFCFSSSKGGNMPAKNVECPKQENTTDCGVFLLENVERFLTTSVTWRQINVRNK